MPAPFKNSSRHIGNVHKTVDQRGYEVGEPVVHRASGEIGIITKIRPTANPQEYFVNYGFGKIDLVPFLALRRPKNIKEKA